MDQKKCIAMLLAGGEGKRLAPYTARMAKPAIPFAAKYRIIDFALSNCVNSRITNVGVLTQFHPLVLNDHIGSGGPWDLNRKRGGLSLLPPHLKQEDSNWYKGTANAIFQNIDYIEQYNPQYVLIISGDHIYKMDYSKMLDFHIERQATVTVAVREVAWEEATRFGIMNTDDQQRILEFEEKPKQPKSNMASMGIYIFTWEDLKRKLKEDELDTQSTNDFGHDVIPKMLKEHTRMLAYPFQGYWKDVGTIDSYWRTSMELLDGKGVELFDATWPIFTVNNDYPPTFVEKQASVSASIFGEGGHIGGVIKKSLIFNGAIVGQNTLIEESIVMPEAKIGNHVTLYRTIVGEKAIIEDGVVLGDRDHGTLTLIDRDQVVFND